MGIHVLLSKSEQRLIHLFFSIFLYEGIIYFNNNIAWCNFYLCSILLHVLISFHCTLDILFKICNNKIIFILLWILIRGHGDWLKCSRCFVVIYTNVFALSTNKNFNFHNFDYVGKLDYPEKKKKTGLEKHVPSTCTWNSHIQSAFSSKQWLNLSDIMHAGSWKMKAAVCVVWPWNLWMALFMKSNIGFRR